MSNQITITLPWSNLAAVIASGAVNDVRYYINGFAVVEDPKTRKLVVVATDGNRLTLARTEAEAEAEAPWPENGVIFEYPEVRPKGKAAKGDVTLTIDPENPRASTISWPGRSAPLPLVWIDGTYPDIWQVIPGKDREGEATAQIAFSPALIAPIQKALGSSGCRFRMDGGDSVILIDWWDSPEVSTALMPVRW
jgi:DNA polymerase III sliding clamp (beta) subunit (PCNA family)